MLPWLEGDPNLDPGIAASVYRAQSVSHGSWAETLAKATTAASCNTRR